MLRRRPGRGDGIRPDCRRQEALCLRLHRRRRRRVLIRWPTLPADYRWSGAICDVRANSWRDSIRATPLCRCGAARSRVPMRHMDRAARVTPGTQRAEAQGASLGCASGTYPGAKDAFLGFTCGTHQRLVARGRATGPRVPVSQPEYGRRPSPRTQQARTSEVARRHGRLLVRDTYRIRCPVASRGGTERGGNGV